MYQKRRSSTGDEDTHEFCGCGTWTTVGPSSDRDNSGSAALLEADSASEEDASGLAADGQEEGKDKGKGKTKLFALGKTKLRPVGPSKVRAQTKLTPVPTDGLLLRIIARGTARPFGVSLVSSPLSKLIRLAQKIRADVLVG